MGLALVGLAPAGLAVMGLALVGLAPAGLAAMGLALVGLAPAGLAEVVATIRLVGRLRRPGGSLSTPGVCGRRACEVGTPAIPNGQVLVHALGVASVGARSVDTFASGGSGIGSWRSGLTSVRRVRLSA
jgi:hypothetical protein